MKRIKYIVLTLGIIAGFGLAVVPATANALDVFPVCQDGSSDSAVCKPSNTNDFTAFIKTIVNTLLFVIAAVAVVTIIISGIRYTTSHGDAKAVQVAKDTLLYAIIGLVVAISSYAIVNFVVDSFLKK